MLSEGIAARRGRYSAYLHRDGVNKRLRGRRGARLAAITSGGAIPDNSLYTVRAEPEGFVVGTVDEDFAVESMRGDILLLGNNSWRIRRVQAGTVVVEDAKGAPPNVPFWRGEAPSRTTELSEQVAEIRAKIDSLTEGLPPGQVRGTAAESAAPAVDWLKQECALDQAGAEQAVEYVVAGRAVLRTVPTQQTIVAERFFDESGGMQLVIHAPFGGRVNKAWGLALRKRFCRSFNFELQAAATDNGLNISLSELHSFPLGDVFRFLQPEGLEEILEQAVLTSPIFTTRWRWVAGRSLALLRFMGGKKVPPPIQRMRSDDLLAAVFPQALACQENISGEIKIPDHPLVRETMKDALTEAMDVEGLKQVLGAIRAGADSVRCRGHPGSLAVLARNPERESLRLSRRRASGRAPRASCRNAPLAARSGAFGNWASRSSSHHSSARRGLAGRPRCRRTARFASNARRVPGRPRAFARAVPGPAIHSPDRGALAPEGPAGLAPTVCSSSWTPYFEQLVSARRMRALRRGRSRLLGRGRKGLDVFATLFPQPRSFRGRISLAAIANPDA